MNTTNFFDRLADDNWPVAAVLAALIAFILIAARKVGGRPLIVQFPRVNAILEMILAPIAVIVIGSLARVTVRHAGLAEYDSDLRALTIAATVFVVTLTVARFFEVMYLTRGDHGAPGRISGLWRGLYYGAWLLIVGALYLWTQGYSITGVWVSTGVIAALIGFALQRTLGDLFAGIALSIERPFELGDWLEVSEDTVGQVTDINWRATRLRGWDNATLVIPNSELAGSRFKNLHGIDHKFAPWYLIKIPAEVDPRFGKELLLDAALRCHGVMRQPPPVVRMADATTVPYTYMVWVHFQNYPSMFAGREELFREVHYALRSAGIHIAPKIHEWQTREAPLSTGEPPTILLALKGLDLASEFSDGELEQLAAASRYQFFDAGSVILREGEIAVGIDVVASGVVESSFVTPDGVRRGVEELGPGWYFGITSMTTSEPSFLQFAALTDVTTIRVSLECMRNVVAANPAYADHLAMIIKRRMDAVEQVRAACRRPTPRLSLHEVLRRVELSLTRPGRR